MNKELNELIKTRRQMQDGLPMVVEAICLEIVELAKQIAPAIRDISLEEVNQILIKEFADQLMNTRYN